MLISCPEVIERGEESRKSKLGGFPFGFCTLACSTPNGFPLSRFSDHADTTRQLPSRQATEGPDEMPWLRHHCQCQVVTERTRLGSRTKARPVHVPSTTDRVLKL